MRFASTYQNSSDSNYATADNEKNRGRSKGRWGSFTNSTFMHELRSILLGGITSGQWHMGACLHFLFVYCRWLYDCIRRLQRGFAKWFCSRLTTYYDFDSEQNWLAIHKSCLRETNCWIHYIRLIEMHAFFSFHQLITDRVKTVSVRSVSHLVVISQICLDRFLWYRALLQSIFCISGYFLLKNTLSQSLYRPESTTLGRFNV